MSDPPLEPASTETGPSLALALIVCALLVAVLLAMPKDVASGAVVLVLLLPSTMLLLRRPDLDPARVGLCVAHPARQAAVLAATFIVILPVFALAYFYSSDTLGTWRPPAPRFFLEKAYGHLFSAAIPEEVFFRGYLLVALKERFEPGGRGLRALAGTSLVFALCHLPATTDPGWSLLTFFPGLLFGFAFLWTGSLVSPIIMHLACNVTLDALTRGSP